MTIYQFEDKGLAHFSYVVMSDFQFIVIDPTRDPKQYYEYAMMHEAHLKGVILTHLHADFVSGHHDIATVKRVPLYASEHLDHVGYKFEALADGDEIQLGDITLQPLYTPGHSYDSISILVKDEEGKAHTLFSGDTLLVGDVGRPDLRENQDDRSSDRRELARVMYRTVQEKLLPLPDDVVVYPAHGAGTLCGKNLGSGKCSTIGEEKRTNPALQFAGEDEMVAYLTQEQPFIPKYFRHALRLNRQGPPEHQRALRDVPRSSPDHEVEPGEIVIDTRPQDAFKKGHLPGAINIMDGQKFETWLGSVVAPGEKFYLITEDEEQLEVMIDRTTRIGYEQFIKGALIHPEEGPSIPSPKLDLENFRQHPEAFTVVDIRQPDEVEKNRLFTDSLPIPLPELRHRVAEIPKDKPIVVHCAGGYRSAIGSSLLSRKIDQPPVYDLGEDVKGL